MRMKFETHSDIVETIQNWGEIRKNSWSIIFNYMSDNLSLFGVRMNFLMWIIRLI